MPWSTPHTTPNRSSDGSRTLAQVRRKVPIGYNGAPHISTKITPSRGPIPKPHYLPHPWTHPTYHPKRHSDPISRFPESTGQTHGHTDTQTNRWLTGMVYDYRPLTLYRQQRGIIVSNRKKNYHVENTRRQIVCTPEDIAGTTNKFSTRA